MSTGADGALDAIKAELSDEVSQVIVAERLKGLGENAEGITGRGLGRCRGYRYCGCGCGDEFAAVNRNFFHVVERSPHRDTAWIKVFWDNGIDSRSLTFERGLMPESFSFL